MNGKKALAVLLCAMFFCMLTAVAIAQESVLDETAEVVPVELEESAHGGGHGGGHDAHAAGWNKIDTFKTMNFVVLAAALIFLIWRFGAPALNTRITDLEKELDELNAKKQAAEAELAEHSKRLSALAGEAEKLVADYVQQGKAARDKILAEAEAAADRLREQASRHMEHELSDAKDKLREKILAAAVDMSEGLIRSNINDRDQDSLVAEYLDKVVAQ